MVKRRKRDIGQERVFTVVDTIILAILLLIIIYPLWYIVIASFSSGAAVASGRVVLWPVDITLDGYKAVFKHHLIVKSFRNSMFYMIAGTALNVFMTIITAYPLSRKDLYGRSKIALFFAFTMWFGGGMIPTFLLYRSMHLINTVFVMIIPGAVTMHNMVITRTYFQRSIPGELLEAAKIDGCSDIGYLARIGVPLAKPIIAVITLYYAVAHWNQFMPALLYINDTNLYPLQLVLRDVLITGQNMFGGPDSSTYSIQDLELLTNLQQILKYAVIVVSAIPMFVMYPFIQRHFIGGMMSGSVKG